MLYCLKNSLSLTPSSILIRFPKPYRSSVGTRPFHLTSIILNEKIEKNFSKISCPEVGGIITAKKKKFSLFTLAATSVCTVGLTALAMKSSQGKEKDEIQKKELLWPERASSFELYEDLKELKRLDRGEERFFLYNGEQQGKILGALSARGERELLGKIRSESYGGPYFHYKAEWRSCIRSAIGSPSLSSDEKILTIEFLIQSGISFDDSDKELLLEQNSPSLTSWYYLNANTLNPSK